MIFLICFDEVDLMMYFVVDGVVYEFEGVDVLEFVVCVEFFLFYRVD